MKNAVITLALLILVSAFAFAEGTLIEELGPLAPFLGSWEGTFTDPQGNQQDIKDLVTTYVTLDGQAVQSDHVVAGSYRGTTIFCYDQVEGRIKFWYFTNAKAYSEGYIEIEGNTVRFFATHSGGPTSAWRATTVFEGEGYISSQEYYTNGSWQQGPTLTYTKAEKAE